jgi:hypothetical protein
LLEAKRRVCILDPIGAWYGLRSSADGKRAGFPVAVFGGTHGDVPIAEQSGATLAHILAEKNLPAIIDLSEMLIGQRHRFVTDFAEAIYRENKTPLHLVIDEADEFIPQNPLPETKRLLHHIDRIIRRGRIRGFRVMMITQRPAVIHKNALTQANTLVVMRLTAPQDRKAIQAWIDGNGDAATGKTRSGLAGGLQRGEGWVWAPELGTLEREKFPAHPYVRQLAHARRRRAGSGADQAGRRRYRRDSRIVRSRRRGSAHARRSEEGKRAAEARSFDCAQEYRARAGGDAQASRDA